MHRTPALKPANITCKRYTTTRAVRAVPVLADGSLTRFRAEAFEPAAPAMFPRYHFADLPATRKWFNKPSSHHSESALNCDYFARFGATRVPLEITNAGGFVRLEQSLSFFLECVTAATSTYLPPEPSTRAPPPAYAASTTKLPSDYFLSALPILDAPSPPHSTTATPTARIYLAQAPLADLPLALTHDVPTPEVVQAAGRGDVYGSSLWLGLAPTCTPLHRDPNPNLLVQLAGRKAVRLFRPDDGRGIFAEVRERIGGGAAAAAASATMRGEEMMQGAEMEALEDAVWGPAREEFGYGPCWQAELGPGDALFIPKGWWHSVRGIGRGMTGSVNWWFR